MRLHPQQKRLRPPGLYRSQCGELVGGGPEPEVAVGTRVDACMCRSDARRATTSPGLGARPLECRTATMQGTGAERKHLNRLRKARNACISFELTNIFCHLKELVLKAEDVIFKKLHFCTSEWSALNIIMPAMYRYMLVYK